MKPARTRKALIRKFILILCGLALLVLTVPCVMIIVAIMFPVFHVAQEKSHQAACIVKLHQMAIAAKQYHLDYGRYPANLIDLSEYLGTRVSGGKVTGGRDILICPDEKSLQDRAFTNRALPYSSYYDTSRGIVWNYWGYKPDGLAYTRDDPAYKLAMAKAGVTDQAKFPRLANRTAPDHTIITHCIHHRLKTGRDRNKQIDMIVRLDGDAHTVFWKSYDWLRQP